MQRSSRFLVGVFAVIGLIVVSLAWLDAQQPAGVARVPIDPDDIGGVVRSAKGPEAGVWVIAETTETPTKFARIVVTDDSGRYVLPDLPRANYEVFVRGYGLIDSPRQQARQGQQLNLTAVVAPNARAAAQVYPAAWWAAMLKMPDGAERQQKIHILMKECYDCHQLGNKATREFASHVTGANTLAKWDMRTRLGPSGPSMAAFFQQLGEDRALLATWTDQIALGEAPSQAPPRPSGAERNVVISLWDWGSAIDGRSDIAASDTRNPGVNANRMVYGAAEMNDGLNVLDPVENKATIMKVPTTMPPVISGFNASPTPSPHFGADMWKRQSDPRSTGIDANGRVWLTRRAREPGQQPAWCGGASANKFGKYFPIAQAAKQPAIYDAKTQKFDVIDTCFSVDHNQFSEDNFLYYGQTGYVGWIDVNTWERTHDAEKSTGWCPAVIDTNRDGKISTGWTEPDQPVDPAKDHRIAFGCYTVTVNPKDGSLWCSGTGNTQKRIVRLEKGPNPPETCRAEVYEPPPGVFQGLEVIGTGGIESDKNGVLYDAWRISGHFTAFDRSKCKTTQDPTASGQSCPEGWAIYRNQNEPHYGNSAYKASDSYLVHMDTWDTLGFGQESPTYGSPNTDSLEVFSTSTRQFATLRVPYPLGFFPRAANGRVDNPNTGWKGKGFWSNYSTFATWHIEGGKGDGGKGTLPKVVKFQVRPNPLAK